MTDTDTRGMYVDYSDTSVAGYGGDGWPGDEWGTGEAWTGTFDRLFRSSGVHQWKRAVEIGSGSGKYTERVLTSTSA